MLKKPPAYILIAILFGALTLLVLLARLSIPIGRLSTDPREIFLTLGAAFSGPIGAIILCAFMFLGASINGSRVAITSTTAHLISLILVAIIYKEIVHKKMKMPLRLLGWIALITIYYWVFLPLTAGVLFYFTDVIPTPFALYSSDYVPEYVLTTIITTLILLVLPEYWQKPLWGHAKTPAAGPDQRGYAIPPPDRSEKDMTGGMSWNARSEEKDDE